MFTDSFVEEELKIAPNDDYCNYINRKTATGYADDLIQNLKVLLSLQNTWQKSTHEGQLLQVMHFCFVGPSNKLD